MRNGDRHVSHRQQQTLHNAHQSTVIHTSITTATGQGTGIAHQSTVIHTSITTATGQGAGIAHQSTVIHTSITTATGQGTGIAHQSTVIHTSITTATGQGAGIAHQSTVIHTSITTATGQGAGILTLGVLGSRPLGTTSTAACIPGVCGDAGGVPLDGVPGLSASCPTTRQAVTPTFREEVEVTCHSRG
jgi:hypothetical protein